MNICTNRCSATQKLIYQSPFNIVLFQLTAKKHNAFGEFLGFVS